MNEAHQLAPLFENIQRFRAKLQAPFYCPGHKGGRTLPPEMGCNMGEWDLNNLPDTDTLHCPASSIQQAQALMADAYGVAKSFFLVGGSSLGNIAAILSLAGPGDKVLVQRNAHKSIISGIIHSGAQPCWMIPEWDCRFGICHGLSLKSTASELRQHPDAKAMAVLNPTYFGVVPNIAKIANQIAPTSTALIADEAHGPHFHFCDRFPVAAEDAGADLTIQSTHKILSGLSQAAVLHLKHGKVDAARVSGVLQSLQTTSPNFAILASIDLARRQMVQQGSQLCSSMLELAESARAEINRIDGLRVMGTEHALGEHSGFLTLDPTKLLIDTSQIGWSGPDAIRFLNARFGVQPELSGPTYILCILTVGSIQSDVDCLLTALRALKETQPPRTEGYRQVRELAEHCATSLPTAALTPREAFYARQRFVQLGAAKGHICGEIITPYPPGIPIIMPGERFEPETIELLEAVKRSGCPISCEDPTIEQVKILDAPYL